VGYTIHQQYAANNNEHGYFCGKTMYGLPGKSTKTETDWKWMQEDWETIIFYYRLTIVSVNYLLSLCVSGLLFSGQSAE